MLDNKTSISVKLPNQSAIQHDPTINIIKFLLILGVVLRHCNLFASYDFSTTEVSQKGLWMVEFVSSRLCAVCVPGFFMISGFLFFRNCENFRIKDWFYKMKKRGRSLLLPYILWNLLGCGLALIKARWLDFPGYGILENNIISIPRLLEGFVDYANGYPYAFAFWFIRNLIVFTIISPIAFLLARYKLLFAIFILSLCVTDSQVFGFEYFTIGAFFSFHYPTMKSNAYVALIGGIIWICGELAIMVSQVYYGLESLSILCSVGAMAFLRMGVLRMGSFWQMKFTKLLVSSTFFLFAIHQFFCTITRNFYISIFGLRTFIGVFCSYFLSFLTLSFISFIIWWVMSKKFPRLTTILGGGR